MNAVPRQATRKGLILLLLAAIAAGLTIIACGMGFIAVSPAEILTWLLDGLRGAADTMPTLKSSVIFEVRLPRILTSLSVGFGLAVAGVVFQGLLLNPLADPFTLGVSSGAAFGAALTLLLGLTVFGPATLFLMAFLGAAATLFAVMAMAGRDGELAPANLILAGVIVSAILSAGLSFIKYLADERVSVIVFWLMGSFVSRTWTDVALTGTVALLGFTVCLFFGRDLNIMSLGARPARSLGVDTARVRLLLLITASLISAVCVAVSGIIGFVGLIVPHLMRMIVGPDNRWLLPASGLGGALLLLIADTLTRAVLPHEVPIGVLTALIGGPIFCWIFSRSRRLYRG
ncbi:MULTISPECIES: iron ABC transporter permease [unclassified Pseudodesulfovibrio]|uniref:FecCD family ABC transporter permease n=1 Tax=unclassified Pseudodesulfovibrio TaxID=2661612 RepID=UPI000FEBBBE0|nr:MULTISPECIES: iron ABC transporter permease [unclassified Pseudodesulfovibrio]MCJ2163004.1 iron ABC transporter permease [Pseudodesulfovibrio sp. S3-i]RWU07000.1 iron ABC transporter permease [Pseudodesulfovibrio sp. S3]